MTWEVFTFGGGEYLFDVFNGIAALTSGDNYINIIKISCLLGLAWVITLTAFNSNFRTVANWFVSFVLIYNVMFLPKGTVLINDQLDIISYRAVENVPLGLAVFASLSSHVGKTITEEFESTFSTPDDLKYHKNGLLFGSKLVHMSTGMQIVDSTFAANINSFMKQCVFYDILLNRYTLEDLKKADDLWNFLTVENTPSQARSFLIKNITGDKILTCKDGVLELNKIWSAQINQSSTIFGQTLFPKVSKDQAKRLLLQFLPVSYNELLNVSKGASDLIKQNMLINAFDSAAADFSNTGTYGTNIYTTVRSNIQTKAAFNASHKQAEEWVPIIKVVLEVLFYGAFPLVFLLFLLPIGAQVLRGYLATFIWLQAWGPLYVILNLMMTKYAAYKSKAATVGYGLSVVTQSGVLSVQQNVSEIAGYLVWFIPFIAAGLTKGMISITGLSTSMLAIPQSAANAAANEVSTGNISLGNANLDNSSYGNVSSNKINDSTFFDSGRIQAVNSLGGMTTITPDGRTVYDQTGSVTRIPNVQFTSSESVSQANSESATLLNNMGENTAKQAATTQAKTIDTISQYLSSHNINENHGIRFTEHASVDVRHAYQELDQVAYDLSKSKSIDKVTAFNMLFGGNIGAGISGGSKDGGSILPGLNFSLSGGVNSSLEGRSLENYNESERTSKSKLIDHHKSLVMNAIKDGSLELTDSHGHSLNQSINEGLQEVERLESQSRVYFDASKGLTTQAQFENRKSYAFSRDEIPDFIEQSKNIRKLNGEKLGEQGVLHILATDKLATQRLKESFENTNTQSIKNDYLNKKDSMGINDLEEDYETLSQHIKEDLTLPENTLTRERFEQNTQNRSIDNSHLQNEVVNKIQSHKSLINDVLLDRNKVGEQIKNKLEDGAFVTVVKAVDPMNLLSKQDKSKSNFNEKDNNK